MSDTKAITHEGKPTAEVNPPTPTPPAPKVEETDWKGEARKWEQRAKENSQAAARLAEIEEANKTAEQKAAEREAAALSRAEEAEARALRREIALDPTGDGKSKPLTAQDIKHLDALTDESAMRDLAKRLAVPVDDPSRNNFSPTEGGNPKPAETDDDKARAFFGI